MDGAIAVPQKAAPGTARLTNPPAQAAVTPPASALPRSVGMDTSSAVKQLLDANIRPQAGRLTLSFANVAAYDRFGPDRLASRFVERDFNRIWHDDLLGRYSLENPRQQQQEQARPVCVGDVKYDGFLLS